MELTCPGRDTGWGKGGFTVCWAVWSLGGETGPKGKFQWYTYTVSSLELDIHHHYLFPRFMSDLYSRGQELVPNITGSKCPHNPLTLLPISCLIQKAVLFFPLLPESLLISCHFFHKIISWVLLSLAYSWECSPPTSVLGKMLWIPLMWVRGQLHSDPANLPTFPLGCEHAQRYSQSRRGRAEGALLSVLMCFVSPTSLSIN